MHRRSYRLLTVQHKVWLEKGNRFALGDGGIALAPARGQRVDQWEVPPVSDGYETARRRIVDNVERLVTELAGGR